MRSAPPVLFPVGRSSGFFACWLALGAVSLGVLIGAWWVSGPAGAWVMPDQATGAVRAPRTVVWLGGLMLWAAWAWLSVRSWRRWPEGLLNWDPRESALPIGLQSGVQNAAQGKEQDDALGKERETAPSGAWIWRSAGYLDGVKLLRVEVALDAQNRLLLRLHFPDAACSWVWALRRSEPARWGDFRRALVHSRRSPG